MKADIIYLFRFHYNVAVCSSTDPKTRQMIQRRYKSSMVSYAVEFSDMTWPFAC
jgi:hypothetical protein